MKEFEEDVREKKVIGNSARHRVGQRHKVTLPSDNMSRKERERMNGPMMEYDLSKPMRAEEFAALPDDLKRDYLRKLVYEYNANDNALGDMFGRHRTYAQRWRAWLGVKPPAQGRRSSMTLEDKKQWAEFIAPLNPRTSAAEEPKQEELKKDEPKPTARPVPCYGQMTFRGSAEEALTQAAGLLRGVGGIITISWQEELEG